MKKQLPAYVVLCVIALAAGLLLSLTNALTQDSIAAQNAASANAARMEALPGAETFEEMEASANVDALFEGKAGETLVGYVASKTVKGYGGDIEVVVGMDLTGVVTGVSVGGSDFSETAGLGAKTKEDAFTSQFDGLTETAVLKGNIDSVTGASISSGAVVDGVNACREEMLPLVKE